MDAVRDGIHEFPTQRGLRDRRVAGQIADLAPCRDWGPQSVRRQRFQTPQQLLRDDTRKPRLPFQPWIPCAAVVIHKIAAESVEQAAKMVEAVTVVSADGSVEHHGHLGGINVRGERKEQCIALVQNLPCGGEYALRVRGPG